MRIDSRAITPVIVYGAGGHMGLAYIRALLELGIEKEDIIAIEPSAEHQQPLLKLGIDTRVRAEGIERGSIKTALVVVPAHVHRAIFEECAHLGIQNVFTEKPLVLKASELEGLDVLGLTIRTGYLINFSPVVDKLVDFMDRNNLYCGQVLSVWGKNWCAVDRPIGPDLEEDLIHPLVTGLRIIRYEHVRQIDPQIISTYVPYIRPELLQDNVQVLNDTSLANFMVEKTDGLRVPVSIMSSFNFFEQRRSMDITLMKAGSSFSDFKACLEFDISEKGGLQDRIRVHDARTNGLVFEERVHGVNKLMLQLKAALDAFVSGARDPRLVDSVWAGNIVQLIDGKTVSI